MPRTFGASGSETFIVNFAIALRVVTSIRIRGCSRVEIGIGDAWLGVADLPMVGSLGVITLRARRRNLWLRAYLAEYAGHVPAPG